MTIYYQIQCDSGVIICFLVTSVYKHDVTVIIHDVIASQNMYLI